MSKTKYILAVHAGHNSSALIGDTSGVLFCVQEERLTRNKNEWGFPRMSVQACLEHVGVTAGEIDEIVFGSRRLVMRNHSREESIQSFARQDTFLGKIRQRILVPTVLKFHKKFGQKSALKALAEMGFDASKVTFYDHHTSHAATAYYGLRKSTDEKYLVLTCDGSGEDLCATVRIMGHNKDEIVATSHWNNSLGAMYSWTTFRMGFVPFEHEYKLMGMAPYATEKYAKEVADIYKSYLWLDESGLRLKRKTWQRVSSISQQLFNDLKGKRFDSICGGLQMFTEDILAAWAQNAVKTTGVSKILAAGGVFMNIKANKSIADLENVSYFEAFPSSGDESLPFGAFYQKLAEVKGAENVPSLKTAYKGTSLDDEALEKAIKTSGYHYHQPESMSQEVAELLAKGYPVARCAGPMEFGARALGNRSILADPADKDVVRIINQMIKKRDFWMPFAPMMKKDKSDRYIINEKELDSPYMMMTFDTRDNYMDLIAAVHNADLTCRAQLLTSEANPEMYSIIDEFEKKTGRAVVLNTSFNLHGFPLVNDHEDALYVFKNSGLEYMQLGRFLISKNA